MILWLWFLDMILHKIGLEQLETNLIAGRRLTTEFIKQSCSFILSLQSLNYSSPTHPPPPPPTTPFLQRTVRFTHCDLNALYVSLTLTETHCEFYVQYKERTVPITYST